jgi:hypothetical protein
MTSATYQTKVPSSLVPYCEAMGFLFGQVERHLYKALSRGEKLNTLKKEYQIGFRSQRPSIQQRPFQHQR